MADDTSTAPSVTPSAAPSPVTGTPASPGVTPAQKPATSPEDVTARIAELERSLSNAKEENDRHSKKLSTYEKQEKERIAAEQAAKDAQLSEIDRITKQHAEAEAKIKQQQQQLVMAQVKLLAKDKGIINPELIAPAVERKLEYDENGEPTNLEKVLDDLIKGNPYLVAKSTEPVPTTPAQSAQTPHAPAIPVMSPQATHGRSGFSASTTGQQTRPTRLSDLTWKQ